MDGLCLLKRKLEEVLNLMQTLNSEDLLQAEKVWTTFTEEIKLIFASTNEKCRKASASPSKGKCKVKKSTPTSKDTEKITKAESKGITSEPEISEESEIENEEYQPNGNPVQVGFDTSTNDTRKVDDIVDDDIGERISSVSLPTLILANLVDSNDHDVSEEKDKITKLGVCNAEESEVEVGIRPDSLPLADPLSVPEEIDEPVTAKRSKSRHFLCPECQAPFTTRGNLNVHLRTHSGDKPFSCSKCSKTFNSSSNLRRHLLTHQGVKPYPCTVCEARFTEKRSLLIHVRKHTGEKPFVCKDCGKRFASSWLLSLHSNSETHKGAEAKKHLCHQCGKSFTQKSHLKMHEKRHAGVKQHVCSYCDMPFTTRYDLKRHEKTHSGSGKARYACGLCGKSYTRSNRLKEHMTRHENQALIPSDSDSESRIVSEIT